MAFRLFRDGDFDAQNVSLSTVVKYSSAFGYLDGTVASPVINKKFLSQSAAVLTLLLIAKEWRVHGQLHYSKYNTFEY